MNNFSGVIVKKSPTMSPKPLDSLKKGLAKISKQIKARKDELQAKLLRRENISPADEEWLDHEANMVDIKRFSMPSMHMQILR